MQQPLDPLGFKQNRYARPNQDWICGRAAEGCPCPLGPDQGGHCRATGQCSPVRKGERWFCTRSDADGGKCAEGPLPRGECAHPISPCQPVPSLRRRRGALVWLAVALTAGALILLLAGAFRQPGLDPGPLTGAHATLAQKCANCHSVEQAGRLSLAAFESPAKRALADSALCLKCHALGDHPLNSHGVAPAELTTLERRLSHDSNPAANPVVMRVSHTLSGVDGGTGEIACTTCHQEHQGRDFDLKKLSNTQCQTCHAVQFASFESGHPQFGAYPYRRRTRIFFDHNSHLQTHFGEMKDKAPASCQDCHVTDQAGRFMQVKSFAQTCAACHAAQIQGEGMTVKGVAFFTMPGLDVDTLAAKGISVGEWPKLADGKITPFMELLLDQDAATGAALAKLHGVDLLDLSKATPDQLAAAGQLAWGVKNLLYDFVIKGQAVFAAEKQAPGGGLSSASLSNGIPRRVVLAAQQEWLPHLLTEVPPFRAGIKPPLPAPAAPAAATPTPAPATAPKPAGGNDALLGGDDLSAPTPPSPAVAKSGKAVKPVQDDLLGDVAPHPAPSASPAPAGSPAGGSKSSDDFSDADLAAPAAAAASPPPTPVVATPAVVVPAAPEDWTANGGWYFPADSFSVFYRPSGHADAFLQAWLALAAQAAPKNGATRHAFETMADPQGPGVCLKCHTVDTAPGNSLVVNWRPARVEPNVHPFTVFQHTPHFSLTGDNGCEMCHVLNAKSAYAQYFTADSVAAVNRDPARFQSNFAPLNKAVCAECHKPSDAGDGCLQCHEYHTGTFARKLVAGGAKFH
jgi:predicted CXXCH cytochrome family protein